MSSCKVKFEDEDWDIVGRANEEKVQGRLYEDNQTRHENVEEYKKDLEFSEYTVDICGHNLILYGGRNKIKDKYYFNDFIKNAKVVDNIVILKGTDKKKKNNFIFEFKLNEDKASPLNILFGEAQQGWRGWNIKLPWSIGKTKRRSRRSKKGSKRRSRRSRKGSKKRSRKGSKRKSRKSRKSRRFGYSHDQGPELINAHMQDGILLADNAFSWMGNPEARAENAGSG